MRTKFIGIFLLLSQFSFSQNLPPDITALWSGTGITGTARTVGSAGAYGSVGADMGCISVNPAGLGLYRSTDFSITPLVQVGNNETVYDGNHTTVHRPVFYLGQGGFVFTKLFKKADNDQGSGRPVRSFSFALNFQEQNIFDRSQRYGATNTTQSLIDGYVSQLNSYGLPISNFPPEVQVAGFTNLLGQNANGSYYSNVKAPVVQAGDIESRGGINRIDAAFGLNFLDKFYIGVDLAVPILGYNLSTTITETPVTPQANQISDYSINTVVAESGYGFNGIIGLIYRPFKWMRVGAAYHLPSWYAMNESYTLNFNEDSSNVNTSGPLPLPDFQYSLRTPMKGDFSASFFYKDLGFLSVDYDMQNLGASRIHVPNDSLGFEPYYNQQIKSTYKLTHTIHAGVEGAIKIVRLRAGYAFSSSPYKTGQEITPGYTGAKNAFTAGIGIRLKHFYVDAAYIYAWSKDASYQLTNVLPVNSIYNTSTVLLTLGWRFEAGAKNNTQQKTQQQRRYTPPPVDNDQRY
jgi:hypothetical protein